MVFSIINGIVVGVVLGIMGMTPFSEGWLLGAIVFNASPQLAVFFDNISKINSNNP